MRHQHLQQLIGVEHIELLHLPFFLLSLAKVSLVGCEQITTGLGKGQRDVVFTAWTQSK